MYLQHWRHAGILKINDLFDTQQNCFPSFDSFRNKFNVRCNFLQYFSLVNAIPQSWKKTPLLLPRTKLNTADINRGNDLQKNLY